MFVSENASKIATHSATLVSYLKRFINGFSESSFMIQQTKKTTTIGSLVFLFMISGMVHLSAQNIGDKASIKTKEGNIIYGTLITRNDSTISVETEELGLVSLTKNKIAKIRPAIFRSDGTYWFENPNPTRSLLGPTAFNLRKGEGNYQNTLLFLQTVNYGLTDHISVGVGFEIASLVLTNDFETVFTVASKISTASDKDINTAIGVLGSHSNSGNDDVKGMILYNATTFGNRDNNFTTAIGFARQENGWIKDPVISVSAMGRVGKRFGLVTENWILTGRGRDDNEISFLISAGGRYLAPSITLDFAIILSHNFNGFRLPWLGITIPFGK